MYKVGAKLIEIPKVAVNKFREWAKYPEKSSIVHDKRFVEALFYILTKHDIVKQNDVEWDGVMMFTRSMLKKNL